MLPSLARLPQQPTTGAPLSSDKFKATVRFIHGNPDRMAPVFRTEGDVSTEDVEILTRWVIGGFGSINQPMSTEVNSYDGTWIQMNEAEFEAGMTKLRCTEAYWATTFGYNGRYHIERDELLLMDTSGAMTWTFVVAITPRGW